MKNFTRFIFSALTLILFSTTLINAQQIICVDRDGSFQYPDIFTDDWQYLQPALDALGYTYDYVEVQDLALDGPDATTMANYDIAFWFTGEVWSNGETITDNDEFSLLLYLTVNGGKLLLSSQDYLYDKYSGAGTFSSGSFPHDGLGCIEVVQDVWNIEPDTGNVAGVAGSCAEGMAFTVFDIYTEVTDDGLYIDDFIQHQGQSLLEIVYPDPVGIGAFQWDPGTYRTIFSTVSYAAVLGFDDRKVLLDKSIAWLLGTTGMTAITMEQSDMLVYPNPATTSVRIGCKDKMQELWIMNSTGQVVDHVNVDDYKTKVNIASYNTGIYFVRTKTDKGISTTKLIVE